MKFRAPASLLLLLLGACTPQVDAPETSVELQEEQWWVVEDGLGEDTGLESTDSALVWGELTLTSRGFAGPAGVEVWEQGELTCGVRFTLAQTGDAGSCQDCTLQMELTASAVQVSADSGCGLVDIDPARLDGQSMSMGSADGVLWMALEEGWEPVGVVAEEDGRFDFEVRFE